MTRRAANRNDAEIMRLTSLGLFADEIADDIGGTSDRAVRRRQAALGIKSPARRKQSWLHLRDPYGLCPKTITAPAFTPAWWAQNDQNFKNHLLMLRAQLVPQSQPVRVLVRDIVEVSAELFRVPLENLHNHDLSAPAVFARHVAMHVAVTEFGLGQAHTGRQFGRDRSVAMDADRKIARLRCVDWDLNEKITAIAALSKMRAGERARA